MGINLYSTQEALFESYQKVLKVIKSCKTHEQMLSVCTYIELWERDLPQYGNSLLIDVKRIFKSQLKLIQQG